MMSEKPVERRLAAVMAADVVGYSRLMGADEVGTLRALKAHRRALIDPAIAAHHGRIVKTTGDGLLAEFPSAVEAVVCAIAIQRDLAARNEAVPEEERLVLRIGINVGDIIIEGNDIFGDGVNVAARLEGLCEPGGLCISRAARDQVRDKVPVTFDDRGERTVKNIARPVRVFGLTRDAIAGASGISSGGGTTRAVHRRASIAAALAIVAVIGGTGAWWLAREAPPAAPPQAAGPPAVPAAATATRASIAVLPFTSLAEEDESDYFADGLTEDIIAALGRFRDISVIARGGVFAYKGKYPTPEDVGRDLNVRYVVEGSVRRSPERIRVSVSLTDTARGALLWSEKYDAEASDIFSVQDRITRRISGSLAVQVTSLELARSAAKPPNSLEAYDLVLRGRDLLSRVTRADNALARTLFERAIELDPTYATAYVGLGQVDFVSMTHGWTARPGETLERAESLARKALSLDDQSPGAHALLGNVAVYFGEYERALDELQRAIEINGSDAEAYSGLIGVRLWTGDLHGAIAAGELLAQFQPIPSAIQAFHLATAYLLADRGEDAVRALEQARDRGRINVFGDVILAAAYAQVGRMADAERQAAIVRQRFPTFSREEFGSLLRDPGQRAKLSATLAEAGL